MSYRPQHGSDPDDYADGERVSCWHCHGAGGFHDCGDDCCPCLDKDEITDECPECQGDGFLTVERGS